MFLLVSCQPISKYPAATRTSAVAPVNELVLRPGDEIEIKFVYTPNLDEVQAIRPDGKISLPLLGEIVATGLTPESLRAHLLREFRLHLKDPEITVVVRSLSERLVYVGGEVRAPGVIRMRSGLTALEAILEAGGFDWLQAEARSVVVIRHVDGQRTGFTLDLREALGGEETYPFQLRPLDIVYVPRSKIVEVGQWIDQHISKLVPKTGFTYSQPAGSGTIGIETLR